MPYCNPQHSTVPKHSKKMDFLESYLRACPLATKAAFYRTGRKSLLDSTRVIASLDMDDLLAPMDRQVHGRFETIYGIYEVGICLKLDRPPVNSDFQEFDQVASRLALEFSCRTPTSVQFIDFTVIYDGHRVFSYYDVERQDDRDKEVHDYFIDGRTLTPLRLCHAAEAVWHHRNSNFDEDRIRDSFIRLFCAANPLVKPAAVWSLYSDAYLSCFGKSRDRSAKFKSLVNDFIEENRMNRLRKRWDRLPPAEQDAIHASLLEDRANGLIKPHQCGYPLFTQIVMMGYLGN